ncbi:MAG: hypothetical protein GY752_03815 [bacterium]|nr:hypothetical protein [bacterium]MCP4798463.1 hypothetical protein [bacterium]
MNRRISFLFSLLLVIALFGCTEKPASPDFTNPLDSENGIDPFDVQAGLGSNQILIGWTDPDIETIVSYDILHSLVEEGPFSIAGSVDAPATSFFHEEYSPNTTNWYKVRGVDAAGGTSSISLPVAAGILMPPMVIYEASAASRTLSLDVSVAIGDEIEIANNELFENSDLHAIDNDSIYIWDLGEASENGEIKYLFVRAFTTGSPGVTFVDSISVDFSPSISLANNTALQTTAQTLQISDYSILEMRFAESRELLEDALYIGAADTFNYDFSDALLDTQVVFGEFTSDFGFSYIDSMIAIPDSLNVIDFVIENGDEATSQTTLDIIIDLGATHMRFAEDLASFGDWEIYQETATLDLTNPADGDTLEIWGQFKNDWVVTNPVAKTIIWIEP